MYGRKMIRRALAVVVGGLFVAVALPVLSQTAYAADADSHIEKLGPAAYDLSNGNPAFISEEAMGGGETPWVALRPTVLGSDAGYIERLAPAAYDLSSANPSFVSEEAMGGGETPRMALRPTKLGHDAGYIERLAPAAYDLSGATH
ncbi:MAG TPA: hypothetical protein DCP92_07985 [Nitrospiraceae bacterium]|jgi:hypothetical protein|nr:hypothetical protein [Nitrospiraceae bacterium]